MGIQEEKSLLRKHILCVLRAFCRDASSVRAECDAMCLMLMQSALWQAADTVLLYMNTPLEAATGNLIQGAWQAGKKVALPKVHPTERGKMDFYYIDARLPLDAQLVSGKYGIREPRPSDALLCTPTASAPLSALVVCPGVAFSRDGLRLGHGAGYYDRWLGGMEKEKRPNIAGLCFSCQIVDDIPHDAHDIRMMQVFSPLITN